MSTSGPYSGWVPDEEWRAAAEAAAAEDAADKERKRVAAEALAELDAMQEAERQRRRLRYGRVSAVLFWPGLALAAGGFAFGFILLVVMLGATALGHETPEFLRAYSIAMLALLFGYPMLKLSAWAGKKAKK